VRPCVLKIKNPMVMYVYLVGEYKYLQFCYTVTFRKLCLVIHVECLECSMTGVYYICA